MKQPVQTENLKDKERAMYIIFCHSIMKQFPQQIEHSRFRNDTKQYQYWKKTNRIPRDHEMCSMRQATHASDWTIEVDETPRWALYEPHNHAL